ncbi:tat twin-arginine translocation pathway signal sequence domain protein [Asticcacaulis biprosthecium C19]|uniref:Tat twin-arginine translocation pathway signal sequence domain protein n=1 Tax=Asticcacaulis biprosthecium C19 TaxID=715226 RepID=F4QMT3_9CAUL|nr:sugar phosphate isomerase/epimerase [Asticcacaulis biprosthecium]EGF91524.1 tat twin-arginine translocation pathway signal sequence domain protein [Asticcacaulis biprosthecium C19]
MNAFTPSRRGFLMGAAALGLASAGSAQAHAYHHLGMQLYTVRDAFNADPLAALTKVKAIGFAEVETAGLAGRTAKEIRGFLDQAGLKAVSSHVPHDDWFTRPEAALDEVATLGGSYAVLAWLSPERRKDWAKLGEQMNGWADLAKARGITVAYHNHDFEFVKTAEGMPFHILMETTDPAKVAIELDCYWASFAGHDPLHVLHEHGDRIKLLHLKDKAADGKMTSVGSGVIDYTAVLKAAKEKGVTNVFVEHDNPTDAFASLQASYAYLTKT